MSKIFVGTKAQAKAVRKALRQAEGLPARGVTVGPVKWDPPETCELDANGDPIPTPGWTTDAVDVDVEAGAQACIDLPPQYEKYLGRTVKVKGVDITLPTLSELAADENALPQALKDARAARRDASAIAAQAATKESAGKLGG